MAATNNKQEYLGSAALACTLTSLASGSSRESATTSNTVNKEFDFLVALTFTLLSGSPSTSGPAVNIYAAASVDGSTRWPRIQLSSGAPFATGAGDASVGAIGTVPNLKLVGSFGLQTTTTSAERTFRTEAYSVAAAFGYVMPPAFSIIVENATGVAFSTSTTTTAQYLEINGVFSSSGN